MANPLRMFRKYQYAFLVAFGIMLMFAFVVAPPLSEYLHTRAGGRASGNPVAVAWRGTALHESELEQRRAQHVLAMRFLESLVRRVIVTQEVPANWRGDQVTLVKGRTYPFVGRGMNEQNEMIVQIVVAGEIVEVPQSAVQPIRPRAELIAPAQSEEELVQRLVLADKARELGVVIGEDAILDYLNNLCDAPQTQQMNYPALLREATSGRLDWHRFQAQLATDLAAQRMLIMAHGGLTATPPEVLYGCYNQLKRLVTAELLAVDVSDFVAQVPEPSEQDIAALYEAGKNRFPYPFAPEPGFKRRQRIAFGFFQGVFEEFLSRKAAALAADITDAEIDKYYEDNKATEFRIPELPAATGEPTGQPVKPAAPAAAEPAAPAAAEPGDAPAAEPAAPAAAEPGDAPAAEPVAPAAAEPAAPAAAEPGDAPAAEPGDAPAAEPVAPKMTLTSYPAPEEPAGQATETAAPREQTAPAPAPPPQYRPLDEALRAEIRRQLARRAARAPAQEEMDRAIETASGVVEQYGRQLARAQALDSATGPDPVDWEAVAREQLLHYGKTPLLDALDVATIREADEADDDPAYSALARATETLFGQQTGMVHRTLIDVGFAGDVAPFVTRRLVDGMLPQSGFPVAPAQLFAYWREEVEPETVPPLDAVRDEVVHAWKLQQALPLARAKAEQLAQQAAQSGQPLATVFADQAEHVIHSDPFTWMTRGSMPLGAGAHLTVSQVKGQAGERRVTVAGTGDDFMRAVCGLQVGQVGVAVNQPQTFVYVVRIESEEPTDPQRRDAFFAAGLTNEVVELAQRQLGTIVRDWFSALERECQIKWSRPPARTWSLE